MTLITLFLIFERSFIKYHGGDREDNIFCTPFYRAPDSLDLLSDIYTGIKSGSLFNDLVRGALDGFEKYHGLNLGSVINHGSLEFRHMPGIKIIQYLKKAALNLEINYPRLIQEVSGNATFLVRDVFKECADSLMYGEMTHDLMQGARLAQRLVDYDVIAVADHLQVGHRLSPSTCEKIDRIKGILRKEDVSPEPRSVEELGQLNPEELRQLNPEFPILEDADVNTSTVYSMNEFITMLREARGER